MSMHMLLTSSRTNGGRNAPIFLILSVIIGIVSCRNEPAERVFPLYVEFDVTKLKTKARFFPSKTFFVGSTNFKSKEVYILHDVNTSSLIYIDKSNMSVVKEFEMPKPEGCYGACGIMVLAADSFLYVDWENNALVRSTDKEILSVHYLKDYPFFKKYLWLSNQLDKFVRVNNDMTLCIDVAHGIEGTNPDSVYEFTPIFYKIEVLDTAVNLTPLDILPLISRNRGPDTNVYDYEPRITDYYNNQYLVYQPSFDGVKIVDFKNSKMNVRRKEVTNSKYKPRPIFYPADISYEDKWKMVYDKTVLNNFAYSISTGSVYRVIRPKNEDFEKREPTHRILETLDTNFNVVDEKIISPHYFKFYKVDGRQVIAYKDDDKGILRYEIVE